MTRFTVAGFNAHWGIDRNGSTNRRRFDVVPIVRSFDADLVVIPESFRYDDGRTILDGLEDTYEIRSVAFSRLFDETDGSHKRYRGFEPGTWELAVLSRLPARDWREIPIDKVFRDHADSRHVLECTVDVGGTDVSFVGVHVSSKLWYAGPIVHLRSIMRELPPKDGPAVIAGDFNFWGPGVSRIARGWRRTVRGRTYPAPRPHSQIDHILVNDRVAVEDATVLGDVRSDHLPVRATLSVH
ncbi:MAG TPA: endonuclease/exonuclease/phosphatase family protein [Acidimicrobiia bacterium]|nr:endonuclease/exonuclease/phosphatase family protein [Acidimicrobiia bacterium]